MLKRIHLIQNIGKFADSHSAGCEFTKDTIIFGDNTQGKSTLTAILRSLRTGNNDILIGRKTFGATGSKKVEIDFVDGATNSQCVFQNKSWNNTNKNIIIFDSKFINDNIFEGEKITFDQQRRMNSIIIGNEGYLLSESIKILQQQCDGYETAGRNKTIEYSRSFPSLAWNIFVAIKEDLEIDKKIQEKLKEIKFETEKVGIKALVESHLRSIRSINFLIKPILGKTLDSKQREIEDHIKTHLENRENANSFLNEGLSFLKSKPNDGSKRSCVFCGQELEREAETLIDVYSAYFKGGYAQLQKEINNTIDNFNKLNIEAIVTKIALDLKGKDISTGLTDEKIHEISGFKISFEKELDKKRDLNHSIVFTDFDNLKKAIDEVEVSLDEIYKLKLSVESVKPLLTLEKEKKDLEITKLRHSQVWVDFCKEVLVLDTKAKASRKERDEKRKELEIYSTSVFENHKKTINEFCNAMGADFEIDDFKPLKKIVGQDERIFAVKFYGSHKVEVNDGGDKMPSFKNTLSESDKRLLAFALFLSLLANNRTLDKKIIVFDDPISSFDRERQRKSIQLIADISSKYKDSTGLEKVIFPEQKIILTHEDRFAKEMLRLVPDACTLKVEGYRDGGNKRSKIVYADFSKDFPDDEIIDKIEKIKLLLDSGQFDTGFELDCRDVLENIFKRKYYFDLKELTQARKGVRSFVTKLKELSINDYETDGKFTKYKRLCDDLNIELHDNGSSNSTGDKESILKDFFVCLKDI